MARVAAMDSLGKRDNQEDAHRVVFQNRDDPDGDVLLMVADGMGGHVGGEIASNLVLDRFETHFVEGSTAPRPRDRLKDAAEQANAQLAAEITQKPDLAGMGCTLLCAIKVENRLIWVSIGDSPLLLLRDGVLKQINADHSIHGELMELVIAGKLSQAEADAHPRKQALRSAVVGEPLGLIDVNAVDLLAGDVVLLASDGVDTLGLAQTAEVLRTHKREDVETRAERLLEAVEAVGKLNQDNTTVVIYEHLQGGAGAPSHDSLWKLKSGKVARSPSTMMIGAAAALVALVGLTAYLLLGGEDRPEPVASAPRPVVDAEDERTPIGNDDRDIPELNSEPEPQSSSPEDTPQPGDVDPLEDEG